MSLVLAHVRRHAALPRPRRAAALRSNRDATPAAEGDRNPVTACSRPAGDAGVLLARIEAEYREMPGMRLTESQAQKLWNLDESTCRDVFKALVDSGFLTRFESGAFGLAASV
jgi:hypothetical protein